MSKDQVKMEEVTNKEVVEPIGTVSEEVIQKWKEKHGEVTAITVAGHIGYLRPPDRTVLSLALSHMKFDLLSSGDGNRTSIDMGKMFNSGEVIMANCWLGGSLALKTDPSLLVGAAIEASHLVEIKEGSLKKL